MGIHTDDPRLVEAIEALQQTNWASLVCDGSLRLVWVSDELKKFLDEHDDERLGCGLPMLEALSRKEWLRTLTPESVVTMAQEVGAFFLGIQPDAAAGASDVIADVLEGIEPRKPSLLTYTHFMYALDQIEPYQVDVMGTALRDDGGDLVGMWAVMYSAVPPTLMQLLARGDIDMYQRMARLVEPRRRQAALLFADVQASGTLARILPTEAYFGLMRSLTTEIDALVASNSGITGKHAGDGVTAFFLADDLGDASRAAVAAIDTALGIREVARDIFAATAERLGAPEGLDAAVNIGVHWGGSLYMGQLVPGSRLDVTALGDEMNECARVQETARDGALLATKPLIEQLTPEDSGKVGLDPRAILYRPLADFEGVGEKAVRDAGGLAVAAL